METLQKPTLRWKSKDRSELVSWLSQVMLFYNNQSRSALDSYRLFLMLSASYLLIRVVSIMNGTQLGLNSDYVFIALTSYCLFMWVLHYKVWLLLDDYYEALDTCIKGTLNLTRSDEYFYPLPYDPITRKSHWNPFNDQCWEGVTPVLIHDWSSRSPSYLGFRLDFAELILREIDFRTKLFLIFWYQRGYITLTPLYEIEISKSHTWVSFKFLQSLPSAATLFANIEPSRN